MKKAARKPAPKVMTPPELAKEVRRMVKRGDFQPGDHLSGTILAEHFGVSRGPVREAFRLLESSGIVHIEPQLGAFVARLEDSESQETLKIIAAIYAVAAEQAARNALEPELSEIAATAPRLTAAAIDSTTTAESFVELGDQLFLTVLKAARSPRVFEMLRDLSVGAGSFYAPLAVATKDMRVAGAKDYALMIDAICAREADQALIQAFRTYRDGVARAREVAAAFHARRAAGSDETNLGLVGLASRSAKRRRIREYPKKAGLTKPL